MCINISRWPCLTGGVLFKTSTHHTFLLYTTFLPRTYSKMIKNGKKKKNKHSLLQLNLVDEVDRLDAS